MKTKHVLMGIGVILLFLASCSQLVGPSSPDQSTIQKATLSVETDLSRGQGVYVNEKGARIDIVSEEGEQGAAVNCVEASKIVEMDQGSASVAAGLFSAKPQKLLKALVLGRRHDGFPGLWLIFKDDSIHAVEDNEEGGKSSKLAESKELNWLLHGIFGWVYHAQTLLGPDSQGGFIIVGYAENPKGFDLGRWEIEPGTTVAVYWRLLPNPHGFFHLSRARIIGQPSAAYAKHWREIDQDFHGRSYRHHLNRFLHSVFSSFRLFFLDWFDIYLTSVKSASYDKQKDVYLVTGPAAGPAVKMEGQIGTATIKLDGIITIALEQMSEPGYKRIVIDTFSPNGNFTANTYIDLFGPAGDTNGGNDPWADVAADQQLAIAWADNGSAWPTMARIDYTNGLKPGTYYIRVRGATQLESIDEWYAIRALSLPVGDPLPPVPDSPLLPLAGKPDAWDIPNVWIDDFLLPSGVPEKPVPIDLGDGNAISRSLYHDGTVTPDVDWFVLVLP